DALDELPELSRLRAVQVTLENVRRESQKAEVAAVDERAALARAVSSGDVAAVESHRSALAKADSMATSHRLVLATAGAELAEATKQFAAAAAACISHTRQQAWDQSNEEFAQLRARVAAAASPLIDEMVKLRARREKAAMVASALATKLDRAG